MPFARYSALLSLAVACASEPALEPGGGAGAESDAARPSAPSEAGGDSGSPQPLECETPVYPDQSAPLPFERLSARVVLGDGTPVANTMAQACGVNLCLFGDTDADGYVTHVATEDIQRVAFKYGDGLRFAQLALLLPDGPTHELGEQITVAFPALDSAMEFEAGRTLRSNGIELVLADAAEIEVDFLTFAPEQQRFVAVEFPLESQPAAAAGEEFELLIALGPVKTKLCPPATLRLPNRLDFAPGTPLEVFLHSSDIRAEHAPYGTWAKVSDAVVSSDGEWLETEPEGGLPMLGVVGVKRP